MLLNLFDKRPTIPVQIQLSLLSHLTNLLKSRLNRLLLSMRRLLNLSLSIQNHATSTTKQLIRRSPNIQRTMPLTKLTKARRRLSRQDNRSRHRNYSIITSRLRHIMSHRPNKSQPA